MKNSLTEPTGTGQVQVQSLLHIIHQEAAQTLAGAGQGCLNRGLTQLRSKEICPRKAQGEVLRSVSKKT